MDIRDLKNIPKNLLLWLYGKMQHKCREDSDCGTRAKNISSVKMTNNSFTIGISISLHIIFLFIRYFESLLVNNILHSIICSHPTKISKLHKLY